MGRGYGAGGPLDQIAASYSRAYMVAVSKLLGVEGGFADNPSDHGGATNYGISLRFLKTEGLIDANHDGLADFDLDMDGDIDVADVRNLSISGAVSLYYRCFWARFGLERFPPPLCDVLLDQEVNDGAIGANKLFQRALNACAAHLPGGPRIGVDGVLGTATLGAMDSVLEHPGLGMPALLEAFREAARARYRAIATNDPSQRKFLAGWLARADDLGRGA